MKTARSFQIFILALLASLFLYQCTNDEGTHNGFINDSYLFADLEEVQDSLTENDTIAFEILSNENDTMLISPGGIRLYFPAGCIGGGNPSTSVPPYSVKLIEIFERGKMIAHNIQTFEGQHPLVSAGMFWLQVKDATGAVMQLNGVQAIIPYQTDATGYEYSMQYFSGTTQNTPSGPVISWGVGQAEVSFDEGAEPNGEFTIWNILGGWSNCDAFMNFTGSDATQFSVKVTNVANYSDTRIFFALDEFTTVAALTTLEGDRLKTYDASIPMNATGKIIAISIIDDVLSFGSQNITVTGDEIFELTVAPGTIEDLSALLENLD